MASVFGRLDASCRRQVAGDGGGKLPPLVSSLLGQRREGFVEYCGGCCCCHRRCSRFWRRGLGPFHVSILTLPILLIFVAEVAVGGGLLTRGVEGLLQELRESFVVLFEQMKGPQALGTLCVLGGIRKLASGKGMFGDGNGRVCGVGSAGGSSGMVIRLRSQSWAIRGGRGRGKRPGEEGIQGTP